VLVDDFTEECAFINGTPAQRKTAPVPPIRKPLAAHDAVIPAQSKESTMGADVTVTRPRKRLTVYTSFTQAYIPKYNAKKDCG
jgi:hypothetical protein